MNNLNALNYQDERTLILTASYTFISDSLCKILTGDTLPLALFHSPHTQSLCLCFTLNKHNLYVSVSLWTHIISLSLFHSQYTHSLCLCFTLHTHSPSVFVSLSTHSLCLCFTLHTHIFSFTLSLFVCQCLRSYGQLREAEKKDLPPPRALKIALKKVIFSYWQGPYTPTA